MSLGTSLLYPPLLELGCTQGLSQVPGLKQEPEPKPARPGCQQLSAQEMLRLAALGKRPAG